MRRNNSPGSTKQGPLKATVPLSLMHQSCSPNTMCLRDSPSNSPDAHQSEVPKMKIRNSPENRLSPETPSPTPSSSRADKSITGLKSIGSASYIRRTASVDTIYLLGQWQRDALYLSYCGRLMMDRATQTQDELDDFQKKSSPASSEALEMKFIRQRLQRTNQHSRATGPSGSHQRHSPVQGDHFAISLMPAACGGNTSPVMPSNTTTITTSTMTTTTTTTTSSASSPHCLLSLTPGANLGAMTGISNIASTTHSTLSASSSSARTVAIPIPDIPKPLIPRMRNSVEGLNQEIEKLVLKEMCMGGSHSERALDSTPEGHRAPIADLLCTTHNANTQTPFDQGDASNSNDSPMSSSTSLSPVIAGQQMDISSPSSADDNIIGWSPEGDSINKLATSPHINTFLAREPPDGCEKVKIAEENRSYPLVVGESESYVSPKPQMSFVLLPSQSSAFYPLCKNCVMASSQETSVEGEPPPQ